MGRAASWVLGASLMLAAVLLGGLAYSLLFVDDPWDPLGEFPTQAVVADRTVGWDETGTGNTVSIPAVSLADGVVSTDAVKCYDEFVQVEGFVVWHTRDPGGFIVETGRGAAERSPGCQDFEFDNPIPAEIAEHAEARFADGDEFVVVAIAGVETPSREGGEGVARPWTTEPFAITP